MLLCFLTAFLCLQKHAKGQELFAKVCDHLNLLEKDYYGLAIWETPTIKVPHSHSFNIWPTAILFLDKMSLI